MEWPKEMASLILQSPWIWTTAPSKSSAFALFLCSKLIYRAPTNQPIEDNESITSEFEPNDKQEHFELWSSDVTSPDEDVVVIIHIFWIYHFPDL